ncbi:MAG: ribonuclease E inhibitor RraB [Alphaproteobacteria bacterium]
MPKLTEEEIAQQRAANARVIELMMECGAEPGKTYNIEHFIYAPDAASAQALSDEAAAAGYTAFPISHNTFQGADNWRVFLTRDAVAQEQAVDDSAIFLLSLCNKYNAIYDGWGAGIPPDEETEAAEED